jgi:hypothetical protein
MKMRYNRKNGRRGQTSVEYLVLLAIAIVIAVVAVGVLSGFIKIGTSTTYSKKGTIYWKATEIGVVDFQIYATGPTQNSTLVLQNNKEYLIRVNWVSIDNGATTYTIDKTLLPGDTYKWVGLMPFNCTSGGSYSYPLTFNYDNLEHNLQNKQFTGVEKLAGACSN